jgi:hypothetical protein
MKGRRDETLGESLTRYVYGLIFWLLTIAVITVETNWFLSMDAMGRTIIGATVLLLAVAAFVVFAWCLRSARDSGEVVELLKAALENPGKIAYNLGGLKKAADEWRAEALTEAGTEAPAVYAAGEEIQ